MQSVYYTIHLADLYAIRYSKSLTCVCVMEDSNQREE